MVQPTILCENKSITTAKYNEIKWIFVCMKIKDIYGNMVLEKELFADRL